MSDFTSFPDWENEGVEPSNALKENGFQAGYKPPASIFNYIFNKIGTCIKELQTAVAAKASSSHTHTQSDVSGLATALSGKANTTHTHAATDITSGILPVARGGTGVTSYDELNENLGNTTTDYYNDITFSSNVVNIYDYEFYVKNGIAFINMTFQINIAVAQDESVSIMTLPSGICPLTSIGVPCQTSLQGDQPSTSIAIYPSGSVIMYSFGYENLVANTSYRFQATYPVE